MAYCKAGLDHVVWCIFQHPKLTFFAYFSAMTVLFCLFYLSVSGFGPTRTCVY